MIKTLYVQKTTETRVDVQKAYHSAWIGLLIELHEHKIRGTNWKSLAVFLRIRELILAKNSNQWLAHLKDLCCQLFYSLFLSKTSLWDVEVKTTNMQTWHCWPRKIQSITQWNYGKRTLTFCWKGSEVGKGTLY